MARGLTAVIGLERCAGSRDRVLRGLGMLTFASVAFKSLVEALTGGILFASWHLGSLGTPIAVCHAGGVLGASVTWFILSLWTRLTSTRRSADSGSTS